MFGDRSWFCGLGLATLMAAAPALAAPQVAGDDEGFVSSGLTSITPIDGRGYSLSASLQSVYDSNILRIGDGFEPSEGRSREDLRITPLVSGAIGLPVGRQQLFFGGQIGRDFYVNNNDLGRVRYSIGGGANLKVGTRCTGGLGAEIGGRQALISETSEQVPSNQETLSYGASANCQAPVGFGFGASIRRIEVSNSDSVRSEFNVNSTVISPQVSYQGANLGLFSISATFNDSTYPNRFERVPPTGALAPSGVDIFSGRFGYSRTIGSRLNVAAGVSYLSSKPKPKTVLVLIAPEDPLDPPFLAVIDRETFSGVGYDLNIEYNSGPRLSVAVSATRNVTASPNVGAQYQIAQGYGVDVSYSLGQAIGLGIGGTYNQRDYRNSFTSDLEQRPRVQDKISRVYGRVTYSPAQRYSASLLLAYQDRDSDPEEFGFSSFSAVLSLNVNFGRVS